MTGSTSKMPVDVVMLDSPKQILILDIERATRSVALWQASKIELLKTRAL